MGALIGFGDGEQRGKYDKVRGEAKRRGKRLSDLLAFGETLGEGLTNVFDTIFGPPPQLEARYRSTRPLVGGNIDMNLTVPFRTAIFGGRQKITADREETCTNCRGTGAQPNTRTTSCP